MSETDCGLLLMGSIQGSPAARSGHGSPRPQGRPGMPWPFHAFQQLSRVPVAKLPGSKEYPARSTQECGQPRGRERAPSGRCSRGHGGAPRPDPGGTEQTAAGRAEVLRHLADDSPIKERQSERRFTTHLALLTPLCGVSCHSASRCCQVLMRAEHSGGQQELEK